MIEMVVGRAVVTSSCFDRPAVIDPAKVRQTLADISEIPGELWQDLNRMLTEKVRAPYREIFSSEPSTLLMSWGPVCMAAVYVGQRVQESASSEDALKELIAAHQERSEYPLMPWSTYAHISNQDMVGKWHPEGVHGQMVRFLDHFRAGEGDLEKGREIISQLLSRARTMDGRDALHYRYERGMWAEFTDAVPIDLSEDVVALAMKSVLELAEPELFLICRYD